jgi:AsmA-like C-terminal region
MATLSPAARPAKAGYKRRLWFLGAAAAFLIAAAIGFYFISANWPYRFRKIRPLLEDYLASQVTVTSYHRTYFPNPGFVATGLTLRRKTALDLPPLGHAEMMVVQGRWSDLLLCRQRVQTVDVTALHIVVPPIGSQANRENFPSGSNSDFTGPGTAIEMFRIYNSVLEFLRHDGKNLIFPFRELDLDHFEKNRAINYSVDMQNAIPSGRIQSKGTFGPLNTNQIGITPVSGEFTFIQVNLHDVGNIAGTLWSTGRFRGPLGRLEAEADTVTPNFSVNDGKPVRVLASVQCTVNGQNGDVVIHNISAQTGSTGIRAVGTVESLHGVQGSPKATNLDIEVRGGRAEDLLRPFLHDDVPITGPVGLRGHAYIAPVSEGRFLHRLHVRGVFNIPAERVADPGTEESLSAFSRRASGDKPSNASPDSGDRSQNSADALSSLRGPAQITDGVASSDRLTFQIPGAEATLRGTFNFHDKTVHLDGDLRMDSDISHTTTGFKSFLLKPLAPFFRKKNAGTLVPIAVNGGPGHYQVAQNLTHGK